MLAANSSNSGVTVMMAHDTLYTVQLWEYELRDLIRDQAKELVCMLDDFETGVIDDIDILDQIDRLQELAAPLEEVAAENETNDILQGLIDEMSADADEFGAQPECAMPDAACCTDSGVDCVCHEVADSSPPAIFVKASSAPGAINLIRVAYPGSIIVPLDDVNDVRFGPSFSDF